MNRIVMVAAGVLVLVACSGNQPETAPQTTAPSSAPHVVFYAEGDGTASGAVTFLSETGGTIQKDVALPMTDTSTGKAGIASDNFTRGATLYMSLQNKQGAGSVTCRIEVDGKQVDTATSSGPYKIASCRGIVP